MDASTPSRVTREEWAKRVERWTDSGLSSAEFAAELGINARTLTYWKWALAKEARGEKRTWPRRGGDSSKPPTASRETTGRIAAAPFVQVHAVPRDVRFEVRLRGGRRVYIASDFDADGLRRLLSVLEDL